MVTEDYVSFKTAELLKEKGFDETCYACYEYFESSVTLYKGWLFEYKGESVTNSDDRIKCPTHQMAMKWLREVHNLHIDVDPSEGNWNPTVLELEGWSCAVKFEEDIPIQDSYEEACEAAIKYSLENLI